MNTPAVRNACYVELVALEDRCIHRLVPLSLGRYLQGARRTGDETDLDMTLVEGTFAEDRMMIEAQQGIIDARLTTADREIVLFDRLMKKPQLA